MRRSGVFVFVLTATAIASTFAACGDGGSSGPRDGSVAQDGAVVETSQCKASGGSAAVASPTFVRNIHTGETGWFSSPAIVDLDKNGKKEIVAPFYSTFVFDAQGTQIGKAPRRVDASTRPRSSPISTVTV